jgi:two-component system LytT family response regulator
MSQSFKTLIIDDEKPARSRLLRLLGKYNELFDIIGEAENGEEGLKKNDELKPDLIFLDIQMPGLNGFEMLKQIKHMPKIIFTTAYEEYAIKAFEENSVDYLLKPIEEDRLELSIKKLQRNSQPVEAIDHAMLSKILSSIAPTGKAITSIPVKKGDRIFIIKLDDIAFLEAKEKYVFINTMDDQELLVDFTLTHLEEKLPDNFIRVHRGHIINKDKVKEVQRYFDGRYVLVLNDNKNTKIISGASYAKEIKSLIDL